MIEIFMPKAGMDMKEGTLIRWLKEEGEPVELDEPVMEIETDKITMEAEAPGSGILLKKIAAEGSVVPVLTVLGYIGEAGEEVPAQVPQVPDFDASPSAGEVADMPEAAEQVRITEGAAQTGIPATPYAKKLAAEKQIDLKDVVPSDKDGIVYAENVLATPLARRIAGEQQIDLNQVTGTGHNGRIMKDDVLEDGAVSQNQEAAAKNPYRTVEAKKPLKGVRKVVGKRMFDSYSQVPTVMQSMRVDMTALIAFRKEVNNNCKEKVSLNDFIIKATAIAVKELPHVRTMLIDGELVTYAEANIGFAVAVEDGLYVPVIKNADILSVKEISRQAKELAGKARAGTIRPDEYTGGTFSISNMGMFDVYTFNPIINQPESGILGITGIEEVVRPIDGEMSVRQEAILCMSYDHRVMDGVGAAKLKKRVRELIEHPMEILL